MKKIRFIDSDYKTLFYIGDGDNIVITHSNGEKEIKRCTYSTNRTFCIGSKPWGICEFAEEMEASGSTYQPEKPQELPSLCFAVHPESGKLVMIVRDDPEYHEILSYTDAEVNAQCVSHNNEALQVTPQQAAAMVGGVQHGWKSEFADPGRYDFYGNLVKTPVDPEAVLSERHLDVQILLKSGGRYDLVVTDTESCMQKSFQCHDDMTTREKAALGEEFHSWACFMREEESE